MLVNVTIPHEGNLVKAEKVIYLDLAHETTTMWHADSTTIVPIGRSVHGLIGKAFDQHLTKLSLSSWVRGLMQKAVLPSILRIL